MPYRDFSDLVLHTLKGVDWELVVREPGAPIAVVAIHGGSIEPLISELAAAIAGEEYNLYDLRGIRPTNNAELRVPAISFDEMRLRMMLGRCQAALHLDGIAGDEPLLTLAGANGPLVAALSESLTAAGFLVSEPASPFVVQSRSRFYNWPERGGAQIELSHGLRQQMVSVHLAEDSLSAAGSPRAEPQQQTVVQRTFGEAVRQGLQAYEQGAQDSLTWTLERFERATEQMPRSLRSGSNHHEHH